MTIRIRTQVAIIGAGPAGLLLAHLLHLTGIESVVLEAKSRAYCEARVRAGALEPGTVKLLCDAGLDRVLRDGTKHDGFFLQFGDERHRMPIRDLAGDCLTIYGQQEVVKDLLHARDEQGGHVEFEVRDVQLRDVESDTPSVCYSTCDGDVELRCDLIAGCDGFHGVSRKYMPEHLTTVYQSERAATWFGFLADVPPTTNELVYAVGPRGYAMHSMRGDRTRLYFQYDPGVDEPATWPAERLWSELADRLATTDPWEQPPGPILDTVDFSIRGFVIDPMQHGRLYLAGDSAHIVPPAGAKGLNAALHDVALLFEAIEQHITQHASPLLERYSRTALRRNWMMLQFSIWVTDLLSVYHPGNKMELKLKYVELAQLVTSEAMARSFAERYLGRF